MEVVHVELTHEGGVVVVLEVVREHSALELGDALNDDRCAVACPSAHARPPVGVTEYFKKLAYETRRTGVYSAIVWYLRASAKGAIVGRHAVARSTL